MSYTELLINTGTVYRYTTGSQDAWGKPAETWAAVPALTDIACRLQADGGTEVRVGAEVVIADYRLFLGDIELTEQDRIEVTAGGSTVMYEILMVEDLQDGVDSHHKECLLQAVR